MGGPRQLMLMEADVQRGPYKAGQPATHMGKILYPQCRKTGVWYALHNRVAENGQSSATTSSEPVAVPGASALHDAAAAAANCTWLKQSAAMQGAHAVVFMAKEWCD